jgi:16S rRNA (uracil1498-N3)-methyltransferase
MEYYFTKKENVNIEKGELIIDDFEFKHLVKVLRKKQGDEITITDGERNIYYCTIRNLEKNRLICNIERTGYNLGEPETELKLYLAPLRNSSRFEYAVEKAVELGVSSIHPVLTEFTVNRNLFGSSKSERLNKIITGAMGQSQRCLLPELKEAVTFEKMIDETSMDVNKIVMYEQSEDKKQFEIYSNIKNLSLLIGPEGGFSSNEISLLIKNSWQIKSLGDRKIRAETAVAVSVFDILNKLK